MRLLHSSELPEGTPLERIRAMLEVIDEDSLRDSVAKLAVPRNFHAQPEQNQAIAQWLSRQFAEWGYEVQSQGPWNNILALPAKKPSSPLLLVGAHYDSVPQTGRGYCSTD